MVAGGSAPAVAEPEVDVKPEGSAPEGSEAPPEPETPASAAAADEALEDDPEFVKFVEKVLGDKDVDEKTARGMLGKEYWAQKNANAELARERDEAKRELEAIKARGLATVSPARETPPAEERKPAAASEKAEVPPELVPQIQRIDQRLAGLANEHKENETERSEILTRLAKMNRDIGKLEGKIEVANDLDKPSLNVELRLMTKDFEDSLRRGKELQRRNAEVAFLHQRGLEDKQSLLSRVRDDQARQKQSASDTERFNKEFPEQFDAELRSQAIEAGVPIDNEKVWTAVWRYVNSAAMAELTSLHDTLVKDVNVPGLIGSKLKEWMDDHELAGKLRFGKQSEEKRSAAARLRTPVRVGAKPSRSPAADTTRKPWDDPPKTKLDLARERINKSFPGW